MIDRLALSPGLLLPVFTREGSFEHWNRFAGANHEFAGHHMDDDVGRHEGFDTAIGMAPLVNAYMYTMLREWISDDDGQVMSMSLRYTRPFSRGRTLFARARVAEVRRGEGDTTVELEVWAEDDAETRLVEGAATVLLARGGDEDESVPGPDA